MKRKSKAARLKWNAQVNTLVKAGGGYISIADWESDVAHSWFQGLTPVAAADSFLALLKKRGQK